MPGIRPRAAWMAGVLSAVTAAGLLTGGPANAVVGTPLNDSYAFTAQLALDGKRSCSGALVGQQWLVTAASCFVDNPAQGIQIPAGKPALTTTATIGRVDADHQTGTTGEVKDGTVALSAKSDNGVVHAWLNNGGTGHGGWTDYGTFATGVGEPGSRMRI
ncbi:trypsin-like serine protease [Streptomyces orinoci]|uniref:Trypsin-like serine protease n=1 Tax=Streptomyces orinoci TaxID=67339 RepID=A0ABV3K825_STRON|nr:trypsin-like serine protease [Streptomyces orinoci]